MLPPQGRENERGADENDAPASAPGPARVRPVRPTHHRGRAPPDPLSSSDAPREMNKTAPASSEPIPIENHTARCRFRNGGFLFPKVLAVSVGSICSSVIGYVPHMFPRSGDFRLVSPQLLSYKQASSPYRQQIPINPKHPPQNLGTCATVRSVRPDRRTSLHPKVKMASACVSMAAVRPTVVRLNPHNPSRRPPRRANRPPDPTRNILSREINPYCALPLCLRFERSEPVAYQDVPARGAYDRTGP